MATTMEEPDNGSHPVGVMSPPGDAGPEKPVVAWTKRTAGPIMGGYRGNRVHPEGYRRRAAKADEGGVSHGFAALNPSYSEVEIPPTNRAAVVGRNLGVGYVFCNPAGRKGVASSNRVLKGKPARLDIRQLILEVLDLGEAGIIKPQEEKGEDLNKHNER
jgi:hypothetical protein